MSNSINIDVLRKKHRAKLVERALSIYQPGFDDQTRSYWLDKLLDGYDIQQMLEQVKHKPSSTEKNNTQHSSVGQTRITDSNLDFHAGLKRKLQISLRNGSNEAYVTTPEDPLFVAYHWYREDGEVYEYDGTRTPLPDRVEPGQKIEMKINLIPPAEPGKYQLMITMVYEGRYWMEEIGLDVQRQNCIVQDYDGRGLTRHALSVFKRLQAAELEVAH